MLSFFCTMLTLCSCFFYTQKKKKKTIIAHYNEEYKFVTVVLLSCFN